MCGVLMTIRSRALSWFARTAGDAEQPRCQAYEVAAVAGFAGQQVPAGS
jgi:hypothetical protein